MTVLKKNVRQVLEAGADGIAVISAVTKADDVSEAVRQWDAVFEANRRLKIQSRA